MTIEDLATSLETCARLFRERKWREAADLMALSTKAAVLLISQELGIAPPIKPSTPTRLN
jgi:hypothetical protein